MRPPRPRRIPQVVSRHGRSVIDDYCWLRAENWREALLDPSLLPPAIRRALKAETRYAAAELRSSARLRDALLRAARGWERDTPDAPEPFLLAGPWTYAERWTKDASWPDVVRRHGDGPWAPLIDGDREAEASDYFDLARVLPSPDHSRLAWLADPTGAESHVLKVRDLATGEDIAAIEGAAGDVAWTADGRSVIYTALDDRHRPLIVRRRDLAAGTDETIYLETDPAMDVYLDQPREGGPIFIEATGHATTELLMLDPAAARPPRLIAPRGEGRHSAAAPWREGLVLLIHRPGAEDGEIVHVPDAGAPIAGGRVVAPAGQAILDGIAVAGDWLAVLERRDVDARLRAVHLATGEERIVVGESVARSIHVLPDLAAPDGIFTVATESPLEPSRIVRRDVASGRAILLREETNAAPAEAFRLSRLAAMAEDGTAIPVTLLSHRDAPPDAPLWLEVYGAYGDCCALTPSLVRLAAAERGMVFAVAHVRGGGERGEAWAAAGRLRAKSTSIGDYLAVARHLIAAGLTAAGRIVAAGESAAGLVVGGALNRAPELFGAAVARVPFVDPLNTLLDPTLPLTPGEWCEFGDPITDPAAFDAILAYSPYDNVTARPYPPVLATAAIGDQRVTYWEPAKWIARLRERSTSGAPLILDVDWSGGHAGAADQETLDRDEAAAYAWALSRFAPVA